MSCRKPVYSIFAKPRPIPNTNRPSARWSSNVIFSATRNGSFHGRITAPVPSMIELVRPARYESACVASGHIE